MTEELGWLYAESETPEVSRIIPPNFQKTIRPVWTENKARIVQRYLKLFTFITKHGLYIDGFAGPKFDRESCAAALIMENQPNWLRGFWLCDINPVKADFLESLVELAPVETKVFHVEHGDFNEGIDQLLLSGIVADKTATFALLDQYTSECKWSTVTKLATAKSTNKIELFYFFPSGWIGRAIAAIRQSSTEERMNEWWGNAGWKSIKGMHKEDAARLVTTRFRTELGYKHVFQYPIYDKQRQGRTMYHMIHAADHDEAPKLMGRAYRYVQGRQANISEEQLELL